MSNNNKFSSNICDLKEKSILDTFDKIMNDNQFDNNIIDQINDADINQLQQINDHDINQLNQINEYNNKNQINENNHKNQINENTNVNHNKSKANIKKKLKMNKPKVKINKLNNIYIDAMIASIIYLILSLIEYTFDLPMKGTIKFILCKILIFLIIFICIVKFIKKC